MSDPFSTAAGVVGILAFGGAVSKVLYGFFMSIHDAPSVTRDLASALCTLNICLGQIQEVLLDPRFISEADDQSVTALQECLGRCSTLFSDIENKVKSSGLADPSQKAIKKGWESVKLSFNEQDMAEHLRRIEAEKSTLTLVLDAFTARTIAGLARVADQIHALAQKDSRRLEDIHVFIKWVANGLESSGQASSSDRVEYSGYAASQAYGPQDMRKLLRSSGSVLSLQLGDVLDGSASVVWTPDSASRAPPRRVQSAFLSQQPTPGTLLTAQRVEVLDLASGPTDTVTPLEAWSKVYASLEKQKSKKSGSLSKTGLKCYVSSMEFLVGLSPFFPKTIWDAYRAVLEASILRNAKIQEDLEDIKENFAEIQIISNAAVADRHDLRELSEELHKALASYLKWAGAQFAASGTKRLNLSIAGEEKRKSFKKDVERAATRFKSRFQLLATAQSLSLQQETARSHRVLPASMEVESDNTVATGESGSLVTYHPNGGMIQSRDNDDTTTLDTPDDV